MLHTHVRILGWALALLCLASTLAFAQEDSPESRGVVATITAIDAKTTMATLQTGEGEVFELPTGWHWQVGDKVECDRITTAPRARLQHCQPWQVNPAGDASTRRARPTVSK